MLGLTCRRGSFRHLFITASFTLPDRVSAAGIGSALIHGAIGGDYLSFAARAHATARSTLTNVDSQKIFFSHG